MITSRVLIGWIIASIVIFITKIRNHILRYICWMTWHQIEYLIRFGKFDGPYIFCIAFTLISSFKRIFKILLKFRIILIRILRLLSELLWFEIKFLHTILITNCSVIMFLSSYLCLPVQRSSRVFFRCFFLWDFSDMIT